MRVFGLIFVRAFHGIVSAGALFCLLPSVNALDLGLRAAGSASEYSARVWQTDEGLPNNRVQAIAQTEDGYLWVGTADGLARFDGIEFTNFSANNTRQLRTSSITALCAGDDNSMWIGTKTGLARECRGVFSMFNSSNGLSSDFIRGLAPSSDGSLWIATTNGLTRFRAGVFSTFHTRDGLLSDSIVAVCEDPRGFIWVATTNGLNRIRDGVVESAPGTEPLAGQVIRALTVLRNGELWIACESGVFVYGERKLTPLHSSGDLPDSFFLAALEDRRTNLWAGGPTGLYCFAKGRFQSVVNNNGMPFDQVNAFFEDSRGDLWVGSREGLIRLIRKPFSVVTRRQWLRRNQVTSVLEDRRGNLWVGTWGGGLHEWTANGLKVYGTADGFASDEIKALCEARDGAIWAGADNGGGLFRITDKGQARFTEADGLADATISVLLEDREGRLWIGARRGLCSMFKGCFHTEPRAGDRPIWAICQDSAGSLWFGGDSGLFRQTDARFERLTGNLSSLAQSISALYADGDGNVWVGTRGAGLWRWRGNDSEHFGTQEGLYSGEILGIAESQGWLWMSSTKGVFRVRRADLEGLRASGKTSVPCLSYGKADGLESIVCGNWSAPTICHLSDGRMCFATTIGLAVFDDTDTHVDLSAPRVYIQEADIDRKSVAWNGGELIIPPSRGELDIRYTALDLRAPERCRFKYRLDGVDSDWTDAQTHRTAHYSNVGPGRYCFQVMACSKDGVWTDAGTSLNLILRPHYWQTIWFRALMLASLAGLAGGIARFATQRKMQNKLELAERQHAVERERGRIAKDIHDDLGASLTRIMLLGLRAERELSYHREIEIYLKKIVNSSRATIQAMDEIVWALNPRHDNLDGLVSYLNEYATQYFQDTPIRCRLQMPVISHVALRTEMRHDLFLAFKEALANVLKHSMASEVHVRVLTGDSSISIVVDDNGKGFEAESPQNGRHGNGLQNMRKRMDAVGGEMEITTAPGHGTRLRFSVRVPPPPLN